MDRDVARQVSEAEWQPSAERDERARHYQNQTQGDQSAADVHSSVLTVGSPPPDSAAILRP